jgi:hypothetical protein
MDPQHEHDLSHRQEREHKKEEHSHSEPPKHQLSSVHPAWYVVVGVIFIGIAVLLWTFIPWE